MASLARRLAAALLLGGFAACFMAEGYAADEKVPDAETIMKKMNSGKKALSAKIGEAAKGEMWDDAQKAAKEFKELGAALSKNDPHKGDKDSWTKLTKKFAEQSAAIADAAEKKDAKALETATKAYKGSCKACHDAHK